MRKIPEEDETLSLNWLQKKAMEEVTLKLKAIEATPENFAEYGQVIEPVNVNQKFGPQDAKLDFDNEIPRFYLMYVEDAPLKFGKLTHHAGTTQCLGSSDGKVWYLAVAKPSLVESGNGGISHENAGKKVVRSACGHYFVPPAVEDVRAFKITGPKFVKMHKGTWHEGPLIREDKRVFYNLERSHTNVVDHTGYNFGKESKTFFEIED